MAERKWGAIASGATFEALATTIIFFENPKAMLFGRRGKDGGQDARSGDGTRVFQAKHHESGSALTAIRDARNEAEKIQTYRQPEHARHDQWSGVTHWRLVTNAVFNPADKLKWDKEIVPLFFAQGLEADYWEREHLNALLDKYPEIHRSFFENETRSFLSVAELRERLPAQEPFLRGDKLGAFVGRKTEIEEFRRFLESAELFLVVHGAGGVGKTRLLVEAGELIAGEGHWQVLWANVASMSASASWHDSIVPERNTLLLVDEPSDDSVLRQLSEQLGGRVGRTALWKVAVAVRSPKDHVLRFLSSSRMKAKVRQLAVGPLPEADAEEMCRALIRGSKLKLSEDRTQEAARELSRRLARHPIWLTLAIQLLEDRGDLTRLPLEAKKLASEYLAEVENGQADVPGEQVRDLIRWVALLGTINREDEAAIKFIGKKIHIEPTQVKRQLATLVSRRVLIERGARNRFVDLKPDPLRDHVLLGWLFVDVGFGDSPILPSEEATQLIESLVQSVVTGSLGTLDRSILVSLFQTERVLRSSGHNAPLLNNFFEALQTAANRMTASHQLGLAELLEEVAGFHPIETARLIKTLRGSAPPMERIEGIFGTRVISQDDVLLALGWPLFLAAMGAQDEASCDVVLRELCALTEAEAELAPHLGRSLPNDGKRASALVGRVIQGGPQFWRDFDSTARKLAEELMTVLSSRPPSNGKRALLRALVHPAVAIERMQTWSEGHSVHFRTVAIGMEQPAWATRSALLSRAKELLSTEATPAASRLALWELLAEAHRSVNYVYRKGDPNDRYYALLLDDLEWALVVLKSRKVTFQELFAARALWDWHQQFESNQKLKVASNQLEAMYAANELASEFEPLLKSDDWEHQGLLAAEKAAHLANATRPSEIDAFVDRAVAFLGSEQELYQLTGVAWSLGQHCVARPMVQEFVKASLQSTNVGPRNDFAASAAASWAASVRKGDSPDQTMPIVRDLMAACGSDDQRANLLLRLYGRIPKPSNVGDYLSDERAYFRRHWRLFVGTRWCPSFIGAVAVVLEHDWTDIRQLLEDTLRSQALSERAAACRGLLTGVYWAVRDSDPSRLPGDLGEWVLDQLLLLPQLDDLHGDADWELEQILKRVGRPPISWLPKALSVRRDFERQVKEGVRAIGYRFRVGKCARQIETTDTGRDEVIRAIDAVLSFVNDGGSVGYLLPEVLRDVDPEGLVVRDLVAKMLAHASNPEQVWRLARIGGTYSVGTPAWRVIAKAAILAQKAHGMEARATFSALEDRGVRAYGRTLGEVPAFFVAAVDMARSALGLEGDADLRVFMEWRLANAEAELREQEVRAREERGE